MSSHQFLFYTPDVNAGDDSVTIAGEEHHHLTRVLRLKSGDDLFATNGRGTIVSCQLEQVEGDRSTARVTGVAREERPEPRLTLALALLKKDRFEQTFEQCVELGISACLPFVAHRSHLKRYGKGYLDRLGRIGVSAMKQSFRALLPEVHEPVSFGELLGLCGDAPRVIVGGQDAPALTAAGSGDILVVVGPEAGLTADEIRELRSAGASFAAVSSHRLRAGTAAVALVAALRQPD